MNCFRLVSSTFKFILVFGRYCFDVFLKQFYGSANVVWPAALCTRTVFVSVSL